ncbi:hypothetical protein C8F04DRAFT_1286952 [Mycena alexandri]|uniref:Uncharacterized protein n=1 Tax=Mycena alexandri TaxID=1745969 RepID=A0AAD6TAU7_9AGAR|nr:hypothetical protein C8F04DRAFT_1286952 [Mycena alexandri]
MSVADPHEYLPLLTVWSTFNIFAACANSVLLAVTLISQGWDTNRALVNLEAIFIVTSACGSLLVWTGHALDQHPPYGLCLANASMVMANVPLMAGSALAIVLKVWGGVMIACHPRWQPVVKWIIWTPVLLSLPYVSGIPLFIAGLVIGIRHPSTVYRGSPFYCVVDHPMLQNATSGFGAGYTFLCLALSVWTTIISLRPGGESGGLSNILGCLIPSFAEHYFSPYSLASLLRKVGIVSLMSTFSAVIPDVVLSSCCVAAFFIFSTSKPILEFVFRGRRVKSLTQPVSPWRSRTVTTLGELPREVLILPLSDLSGSDKSRSVTVADEHSLWQVKAVESSDRREDGMGGHSKHAADPA